MLRHPDYTRTRLAQLADRMFQKIYPEKRPVDQLLVVGPVDRITRDEALVLDYRATGPGEQFGPLWATYWFKAAAQVPADWKGSRIDLLWVSHSEATLWIDGRTVQGLNYEPSSWDRSVRPEAMLTREASGGEELQFEVEMACNRMFGEAGSPFSSISPFVLDQCDIARFDPEAWEMYFDFSVLQALEAEESKDLDKTWAGELLSELNRFANSYDPDDHSTWAEAKAILEPLYTRHNASQVHELSAIGHAHIDTAWLWPIAETHRKCTRTFSSQTTYMEDYPEYKFACSQAYQYKAMKELNPDLYERIREKVKGGQFVPVGGTWVEPDCNIPSGESLARQFLYGQRYFQQEFGIRCKEFWNPDVFGYNGQLPQIMLQAGISRFLTQKLSWNRFNKPVFHTFTWQGIDGSEALAHFPPADTYNASAEVSLLRDNARHYKDHDRSRNSIMLFGWGDGGGGPTRRMLEILRRARDLQGLPRTQFRSSDEFFDRLEADCIDRPLMIGELYFEYHRGTYTTQGSTKRNNRKNEFLLHDVEFLAACASRLGKQEYPKAELDRLWELLLVNQFHDILPGSSITLVYEDTERQHHDICHSGNQLRSTSIQSLCGTAGSSALVPVNTTAFCRMEVATDTEGALAFIETPPYGTGRVIPSPDNVTAKSTLDGDIVLENRHLRAQITAGGLLCSLVDKATGRESLSAPGNRLEIYDDHPTSFDAWDVDPFHMETRRDCPPAASCQVVLESPLRVEVKFERVIGAKSSMTQIVRLDADGHRVEFHTEVDWHEANKMLKAAFPVAVRSMNATYEMQFGEVERPTHYNTSYDLARFEVPGHKWVDLSEHGFGVALLSESKYGFSTFGDTMRISLLRSPKSPDPIADMGRHVFSYALMPHAGGWQEAGVVADGYRFNAPILWARSDQGPQSFASVNDPNLVLDTIKQAEDGNEIVLRLYECHGSRGVAQVKVSLPFTSAVTCNILEEDGAPLDVTDGTITIAYTPHQLVSVKLK